MGLQKFPMKGGKASFYQTNCWDFWAVENPCDDFVFGFFSNQFGMVKSLHLIFLRGFRWLVAWLDFKNKSQKSLAAISRPFSHMFTHTRLVVEIITNKNKGNRLEPLKNKHVRNGWLSIRLDDEPNQSVHVGNMRTKKSTKLPETRPVGKNTDGLGFQVFQGRAGLSRYGPLRKSVALLLAPPGHGDVMKVGTLADSGAEARKFNLDLEMGCWIDLQMGGSVVQKRLTQPSRRSPDFQFLGIIYIYFIGNMSSFRFNFCFMVRNGGVGNSLRSTIFLENSRCDVNFHQLETPKIQECFFSILLFWTTWSCCKNSWDFGFLLIWRN